MMENSSVAQLLNDLATEVGLFEAAPIDAVPVAPQFCAITPQFAPHQSAHEREEAMPNGEDPVPTTMIDTAPIATVPLVVSPRPWMLSTTLWRA